MQQPGTGRIIGIDLGTTNSVVAIIEGREPIVVPNQEGANKTPSVVAFLDNNECIVGEIARRQAATNPTRTISSIKRIIGLHYEDVEDYLGNFPFEVVEHNDRLLVDVDGYGYTPEQVSALILKKLKESAEAFLSEPVGQAVLTVPAHFDDNQRNATIEAARTAGLEVIRLLNEPTAAALAYGLGKDQDSEEIIAVFDFGGGTFDITLLEVMGKTFEVLTSTGDTHLGGDDLDNAIVNMVVEEFYDEHQVDLTQDPVTLRRLKEVAEKAKCELSSTQQTVITLPFIAYKQGTPLHLERTLTRQELEEIIEVFVNRTIKCCRNALEDSGLSRSDIEKVILVGGSTRIPMVQEAVEDFFGLQPFKGINPDEVVALGAATQAGIFTGNLEEVTLLDVAPHSLGIEVKDGKFSTIIEKNATIPIKAAKNFTTTEDNQTFVNIHILQGENSDAAENRSLGKFALTNIPPEARGKPRVRVTFFVNADGVMEISAEELSSNVTRTLTIVHSELDESEKKQRRRARKRRRKGRTADRQKRMTATDVTGKPTRLGGRRPRKDDSSVVRALEQKSDSDSGAPAETGEPASIDNSTFDVLGDTNPGSVPTAPVPHHPPSEEAIPLHRGESGEFKSPVRYTRSSQAVRTPVPLHPDVAKSPEQDPVADQETPVRTTAGEDTGFEAPENVMYPAATPIPISDEKSSSGSSISSDHVNTRVMKSELTEEDDDFDYGDQPANLGDMKTELIQMDDLQTPLGESADAQRTLKMDVNFPDEVDEALALADEGAETPEAIRKYTAAVDKITSEFDGDERFEVLYARALLRMMLGQAEEMRKVMNRLRETAPSNRGEQVLTLQDKAIHRFVTNHSLRRDRALLREQFGDLEGACEDMEFVSRTDPSDNDPKELERLYKKRMGIKDDPAAKFKLVKLYLKSNRVDESVEILEELQTYQPYETRAVKILGLCHWQKNLHVLAWQKFRQLELNDEIRDILYRLAGDMEAAGHLQNALPVLEHLERDNENYRDVKAKVKKLKYRIKMMEDEQESSRVSTVLKDTRFEIIEEINRGSMGIIYKARDKTLDEVVALKVLNDYLCSDPSAVERFKREARAAKKLSHPYIVRIHDMFETGNKRFISMEYIEGNDLKRMLANRTSFNEDQLVYYFIQICDALSYAHKLNIIHRDIKPANIMITGENSVKITDFGIAKILKSDDSTKSGTAVIGTPLYMAPEQITGEGVDARTDIYSLGIMMYELVAGHPPFYLGNIEYHHIHTAPPPLPEKVSPALRSVVMKCVEKDPSARYQHVEEILEQLNVHR